MPAKPFLNFSSSDIENIFRVNVFSQYWTLQEFLPDMIKAKGHVVSICSVAGVQGTPYLVPYCSSKFALKGLMDALFFEIRKDHGSRVTLTTVHPFTIDTGLAVNPTTRFPWLIPILTPEYCAEVITDAILKEEEEVFIPKHLSYGFRVGKLMPRRVEVAGIEFLNCGVGHK